MGQNRFFMMLTNEEKAVFRGNHEMLFMVTIGYYNNQWFICQEIFVFNTLLHKVFLRHFDKTKN
jgi:hypothetical protein